VIAVIAALTNPTKEDFEKRISEGMAKNEATLATKAFWQTATVRRNSFLVGSHFEIDHPLFSITCYGAFYMYHCPKQD